MKKNNFIPEWIGCLGVCIVIFMFISLFVIQDKYTVYDFKVFLNDTDTYLVTCNKDHIILQRYDYGYLEPVYAGNDTFGIIDTIMKSFYNVVLIKHDTCYIEISDSAQARNLIWLQMNTTKCINYSQPKGVGYR